MHPFFRLIRLPNLAILAAVLLTLRFAVLAPTAAQLGQPLLLEHWRFALLVLAAVAFAAAGYIINNLYDIPIDRINDPHKNPLIEMQSPKLTAYRWYVAWNAVGVGATLAILQLPIMVFNFATMIALWAYSRWLKRQFFIGNILVALLCGLVVIEAWWLELPMLYAAAAQQLFAAQYALFLLILYTGFAFLTTLLRELVKDVEDMEGDRKLRCQTVPIVWGIPRTASLCLGILAVVAMLLVLAVQTMWHHGRLLGAGYVVLGLIVPLFYLIYLLRNARQKEDFHRLSTAIKWFMLSGLLLLWFS